jgi:hypothetical protein
MMVVVFCASKEPSRYPDYRFLGWLELSIVTGESISAESISVTQQITPEVNAGEKRVWVSCIFMVTLLQHYI